uniref:G protein-coupled receptor 88 n=1 Tax=Paramormyrops kingsleyae TaxID=1676925 RepID=A0A3B3RAM8_9TELE|nr:probable G-protein coupled receptor 88 [Paramormyrops kingsleyae]
MTNHSVPVSGCEVGHSGKTIIASIYILMCLLGSTLNVLVIYLVVSFKKLRTTSNAFIVNGSVADLLVCAIWIPHEVMLISTGSALAPEIHALSEALLFLGITVSLLSHSLIAANRYVLITKAPATYVSLYQKRNAESMIIASWLLALGCLLPWLVSSRHAQEGCSDLQVGKAFFGRKTSVMSNPNEDVILALTIFAQSAIVLYCYFKIFRRVQISMKRVSILNFQILKNLPYSFPRKDRRLGFYVLTVCGIFLITTQPLLWVLVVGRLKPVPFAHRSTSWMLFCCLFVLNPFLYTWKNEEFRRSFKSVLRGEICRGSAVGLAPVTVNTVAHILPRQNSRRAFIGHME